MKKNLFFGMFAAAGLLLATSCTNDELAEVQSGNEAQVKFALDLEGGISTRAISDGTGAKKLIYAVYKLDANDEPVLQKIVGSDNNSQVVDGEAFEDGLKETVTVSLAKGQTYQVAFWAQNPNCSAYTTTDLTDVKVNYQSATNNNDVRDAFFKTVEFTVSGNQTIDVELKRPFAQINVGVYKTDWEAAVASGIEIEKSSVVIKNAATSINLLTGEVGDETTDVEVSYVSNTIPNEDLKVDLNGDKDFEDDNEVYKWLSMSYILVADHDENADDNGVLGTDRTTLESLQYTFSPKSGNKITFGNGLNSVPVQRNWRTNILGQILTGDIQFNITINPIYDGDNNVDAPVSVVVSTQQDFLEAIADPTIGEVILDQDIDLNGSLIFGAAASAATVRSASTNYPSRDIVIDGNGGTITFTAASDSRLIDFTPETNGANLTLKNITLENKVSWIQRGVNYNTYGTLTLDNVTIKNAEGCSMNYAVNLPASSDNAKVEIKDCNIEATANALNLWGENTIVNVTNSHLSIIDNSEAESYSVIALNNDGTNTADYSVVTVTNGSVKVTGTHIEGSNAVRNSTVHGKVEISKETEVVGAITEFVAVVYFDGYNDHYIYTTLQQALDRAKEMTTSAGVRMIRSINDHPVNTTAPYGNYYGVKHDGVILDGNGNTLDFELGELKNKKVDNYGIMTSGGTIKNMTITGVFRGIMIMNPTQDLSIENVTIGDKDVCYAINTGEGDGTHSLSVANSTIKGWSSYGTAIKDLTFTNCTFAQGEYYTNVYGRLVKPYVNTVFDGCEFNSKFYIDLSQLGKDGDGNVVEKNKEAKITLKNCTVNGVKLTSENWKELIASESDCKDGQISIELKDGSYMTANNTVDYVVIE